MMNIAGDKSLLGVVKVHSTIDLITNSSTEIFCVVEGSGEKAIQGVIDLLLEELGCECIQNGDGLTVERYEKYDEEKDDYVFPEDQYAIYYEQHAPPCKMIMKRLEVLLTVVEKFN